MINIKEISIKYILVPFAVLLIASCGRGTENNLSTDAASELPKKINSLETTPTPKISYEIINPQHFTYEVINQLAKYYNQEKFSNYDTTVDLKILFDLPHSTEKLSVNLVYTIKPSQRRIEFENGFDYKNDITITNIYENSAQNNINFYYIPTGLIQNYKFSVISHQNGTMRYYELEIPTLLLEGELNQYLK